MARNTGDGGRTEGEQPGSPRRWAPLAGGAVRRWDLWLGALGFLALTIGVFVYQFAGIPLDAAAPRWRDLRWGYLALLGVCLPVETLASALRIWVLARILEPRLAFWTCLRAEWANVAVSILTPSQSGGGPGQIYVLTRGGARVGTALTISLLSFVGTMAGLLVMGLYALATGRITAAGLLFRAAAWSLTAIALALLGAAAWPGGIRALLHGASRGLARLSGRPLQAWWPPDAPRAGRPVDRLHPLAARLADLVYAYRADLGRFLRAGKPHFAAVCALSLVFLATRCVLPYLCARFLGLRGGTLREVVEAQMALVFLVFFAPTPGGAGVAETASLSIMGGLVPAGYAPYYNLLWRFSTAYLAALAGGLCLGHALLADLRRAVRRNP